jgi:hypothetical protein
VSGDDDRGERPRLSWSEIDKRRDRARTRSGPRSASDEGLPPGAAAQYRRKLDRLFASGGKGASADDPLARAVRDAQGTPALAEACRAYLAQSGPPSDPALLSAFLDASDREVQLAALGMLAERAGPGGIAVSGGLRAQLRMFAAGLDDALAEAAEAALARL